MSESAPPTTFEVIKFDCLKEYPDAIEQLEKALQWAKEGKVLGVAMVMRLAGNETATVYTSGMKDRVFEAVGGVEYLKFRLLKHIDDL